jgi:hypothetical protein
MLSIKIGVYYEFYELQCLYGDTVLGGIVSRIHCVKDHSAQ